MILKLKVQLLCLKEVLTNTNLWGMEMVVVMAVLPEKCFGHVQKRMGSTLTEYKKSMKGKKLSDGKGVGSAGRLTDDVVKKIQDYYSFAIQQNKGDMMGMVTTIKTI